MSCPPEWVSTPVYKKLMFGITGLIFLSTFVYSFWRVSANIPPCKTAEAYIRALCSGDAGAALQNSSGGAAVTASRLKGSKVTAQVEDVSCSVAAMGRWWARVLTTVELILQDGTADVGWYALDAVKTGREWKVVSFREADPEISGTGLFVKKTDVAAAKQVFESYLDALAAGDWQGAAKYLAGPARRSQEMSEVAIGKGAVIGRVEKLKAEPVWKQGKSMAVRFSYKVDDRNVSVFAVLYRTIRGLRIIKIHQMILV